MFVFRVSERAQIQLRQTNAGQCKQRQPLSSARAPAVKGGMTMECSSSESSKNRGAVILGIFECYTYAGNII